MKTRKTPRRREPLSDEEAIAILEEVARTGPMSARIQALRLLLAYRASAAADDDEDEFAELDELEVKRRRGTPTKGRR